MTDRLTGCPDEHNAHHQERYPHVVPDPAQHRGNAHRDPQARVSDARDPAGVRVGRRSDHQAHGQPHARLPGRVIPAVGREA
ncbi:hypothetical protein ACFFX0_22705 [Citricoccus parietis]|uniref:Uncharacterized protein n=1 Tax=Citricoccus parietis TaxID=592307 RepID=A0ABV5G4I6_9MICC